MEKFKRTLRIRLIAASLYSVAVLVFLAMGATHTEAFVSDFIGGFSLGLCSGIEAVVIFSMAKYVRALRDGEKLRKLYIEERDERMNMIRSKAGGAAMVVSIAGLLLAALVAGYFDATVFATLICAALVDAFAMIFLKFYYAK